MKLVIRKWRWLAGLLAAGMICATYLVAQVRTTQAGIGTPATGTATMKVAAPDATETADSARLIGAVNAGDAQTALKILHTYGVAEDTLLAMATRLGTPPARVALPEPFLKASMGALAQMDGTIKASVKSIVPTAAALGYERPVWVPRRPDTRTLASYDAELDQCTSAPMAVLNVQMDDPCFIRFFQWYDRYAEQLHSVVLNGDKLVNAGIDLKNFGRANRTLNALFQLVKARNPDAFVWLSVVKKESHQSDELWLKAMTFQPDGLQISNLRQFHSPFADTRRRYAAIVGTDMPMMVAGFYGQEVALHNKGNILSGALKIQNPSVQAAAATTAEAALGGIGVAVAQDLSNLEINLQALGYRGLSAHWLLLIALSNSTNAAPADSSELIDSHAGLLDIYYGEKDYAHVLSLAANMVSNSSPGDMNWTIGRLYEGIAWLSQTPPDTNAAIAALDEILNFNFANHPGRDHYILGAVQWRIRAAFRSGDMAKPRELVQWVQNQPLRTDLKSAFLKQYGSFLSVPTITSH